MLFATLGSVRMVKNSVTSGLKMLPEARGWGQHVQALTQFFTIRTSQLANDMTLYILDRDFQSFHALIYCYYNYNYRFYYAALYFIVCGKNKNK